MISLLSHESQAILCTEDYCNGKTCPEVTEETCKTKSDYPGQYRFEKKGGVCACCPTCIKVIRMCEIGAIPFLNYFLIFFRPR